MKKEIRIGTRTISETSPVFVVAEISGNHNQDYGRAIELIHAAGGCRKASDLHRRHHHH